MDSPLTPLRAPRILPLIMLELRAWERSVPRPPEPTEPADVADSAALAELPAAPPPQLIPTGRWTSRPTWAAQGGR